MYVLLNRDNIVVDILENIRYIKRNSQSGIVIACEKDEGIGVIGSDCNTHYILIDADTTSSPDAVRVLELEEIPSNVRPYFAYLDTETGELICDLDSAKQTKQEHNKILFANYLANHPLTWVDGKTYGITEADQSEISLNLNKYQISRQAGVESPVLEWHAQKEECVPWTLEDLLSLSLAITEAVYPIYHKMQQYKTAIFSSKTIEELEAIDLDYEDNTDSNS